MNTFGADTGEDVTDWGQENVEQKHREANRASPVDLSPRELITIVAALRHWQGSSAGAPGWVHDLTYGCQELTVPGIDALCERVQPDTP